MASSFANKSFNSATVMRRARSATTGGGALVGAVGKVLAFLHSAELQAVKTPRAITARATNEIKRRIKKPPRAACEPYSRANNKLTRANFLCHCAFVNPASTAPAKGACF